MRESPLDRGALVLGTYGSGKSSVVKQNIRRGSRNGISYHVIDPHGEYVTFATQLGGVVQTVETPDQGTRTGGALEVLDLQRLSPEDKRSAAGDYLEQLWAADDLNPRPQVIVVEALETFTIDARVARYLKLMTANRKETNLAVLGVASYVQTVLSDLGIPDSPHGDHSVHSVFDHFSYVLILGQDRFYLDILRNIFNVTDRWLERLDFTSAKRGQGLLLTKHRQKSFHWAIPPC